MFNKAHSPRFAAEIEILASEPAARRIHEAAGRLNSTCSWAYQHPRNAIFFM